MPAWQLRDARKQAALHFVNMVRERNNAALADLHQGLNIYNELQYPAEESFCSGDPALSLTVSCTGCAIPKFLDLNPFSCQQDVKFHDTGGIFVVTIQLRWLL